MKSCSNCGYSSPDKASECAACGHPLAAVAHSAAAGRPAPVHAPQDRAGRRADWNGIFDLMAHATMKISVSDGGGMGSSGTGFFLEHKGSKVIITNCHVVEGGQFFTANFDPNVDSRGEKYPLTLLAVDSQNDLAALRLTADMGGTDTLASRSHLTLADMTAVKRGDNVCTLGNPKFLEFILTRGSVSGIGGGDYRPNNPGYKQILVNIDTTHGNSGGPVCNEDGEVIGIITAGTSELPNQAFCVTAYAIEQFVSALAAKDII